MATCRRLCCTGNDLISKLNFSTTCSASNNWRRNRGLEPNPRKFCALTNLPDYSFVDGRPAILSYRKIQKLKYQQDICKKIVEFTNELDVGLEKYYEDEKQMKKDREEILKNKLKPKGAKLVISEKKKYLNPES